MQNLDIHFLNNLKEKLSADNLRSIYLNALPAPYLTRLDLADLDVLQQGKAKEFLDFLFTQARFDFPVAFPANRDLKNQQEERIVRRLSSITIENNDHYADHGSKTFGFGYPIILLKDPNNPDHIIKAPLIVWSLDIERDFNNKNQWMIRKKEHFSVMTNTVLTTFLRNHANIDLEPMYEQILEDSILDKDELAAMAHLHMQQLNPNISDRTQTLFRQVLDGDVAPIKTSQEIEALPLDKPAILWSGVFGLFRSQKDAIIKDLAFFTQNIHQLQPLVEQNPNPKEPNRSAFMKHRFTMLETDPSQQHLLHQLSQGKNLVIQGPPGTGKSQTLTGIIANTISNAGTCLIVCEKKNALDVIYNTLQKMGLEELCVIIEDVYRDRPALVNSVRERAVLHHNPYRASPSFNRLLQSCAAHVDRLQGFHKKLQKPLSGDDTWIDLVGRYLDSNHHQDKNLLIGLLKTSAFEFNPSEFEDILSILAEGENLFKQLGTLHHPFNALDERFFHQANALQVEAETQKALDNVYFVVQSAQRDAFSYLFEYEQLLEQHFSEVYLAKMKLADRVMDIIESGLAESKYHFNKNGGFYRTLMKNVSNKYKKLELEKVDVLESFLKLQKVHAQYAYFKHQFLDVSDHSKLEFQTLLDHIVDYKTKVYDWFEARAPFIQQVVKDLGPGKIYPHVSFEHKVSEITKNLNTFEKNFATSKVFKVQFKFVTKNIRRRLTQMEALDENLQKLKEKFDTFKEYHALKFFWLKLDKRQQATLQALSEANPKDWTEAFTAWYLSNFLAHHNDQFIPDENNYSNHQVAYLKELPILQKALIEHTLKYWRSKQSLEVQTFHKNKAPLTLSSLYNTVGQQHNARTPLRKIITTAPELFTSFFPVLMVSPAVCSTILPLYPSMFDVVIFDEASQLNLEESFAALVRGKYKIIAGDSHQMPPPDRFPLYDNNKNQQDFVLDDKYWEDQHNNNNKIAYLNKPPSLLDYALSTGTYQACLLEVHYRSKHPFLIDFSNAAFYGNRLTTLPLKEANYTPIEFKKIKGIYHNYSNQAEAKAILDYVLDLVTDAQPCPSVGIATFNLHQRNLILEEIQQLALQQPEARTKFQFLFQNGLFVKSLENIQGDERDILILSTTFGLRADGSMPQNWGPIKEESGYQLLNVAITRAKQKVCVFNSIPPLYYQTYPQEIKKRGNTGKGILYAYLAYANAVQQEDEATRMAILDLLYQYSNKKTVDDLLYHKKVHLFEQEVLTFLGLEFPNLRIEANYQHAGFALPIAILDDQNQVCLAFYYDIYHDKFSEEAYAWDLFHEQYLQQLGVVCHRIWSKEWWQNRSQAQQKLVVQIRDTMD